VTDPRVLAIGTSQSFRQQVARALEMPADRVDWVGSVTAAEEFLVRDQQQPEVLVLSPAVKEADAFGLAEFATRTAPATAVVLVRERPVDGLLAGAVRAGMRDVVNLSKGGQELRDSLERAIAWSRSLRTVGGEGAAPLPSHHGRIITVFSSKGGTGKTFLATNLAAAIARQTRQDTAIVDLDLRMGDVFSYFGAKPERSITELIQMGDDLDRERVLSVGTKLNENLWGYGAPSDPSAEQVAGETVGKVIRAIRGTFAFSVIDLAADYSDQTLAAFDLSDTVCLITGLDVVGVRHLSEALETLLSIGVPRDRFRFVLNRADSKVGLDAGEVEKIMRLEIDAMIPSSRLVPTSLNKGRVLFFNEPGSSVAKSIASFAARVAQEGAAAVAATPLKKRRLFARN
jgi:pilus assembly protein CpaE